MSRINGYTTSDTLDHYGYKLNAVTPDVIKRIYTAAIRALRNKGWTQSAMARTETGRPTDAFDKNAVCFCTLGALHRGLLDSQRGDPEYYSIAALVEPLQMDEDAIAKWNDDPSRTVDDVIALLEEGLERV